MTRLGYSDVSSRSDEEERKRDTLIYQDARQSKKHEASSSAGFWSSDENLDDQGENWVSDHSCSLVSDVGSSNFCPDASSQSDINTPLNSFGMSNAGSENEKDYKIPIGITLDGLRTFAIPSTQSLYNQLFLRWYSFSGIVTWICILCSVIASFLSSGTDQILFLAIFWRVLCNLGLGILLKSQDKWSTLSLWVTRLRREPFSLSNAFWSQVVSFASDDGKNILNNSSVPPSFSAWIILHAYMNLVDTNDIVAFTCMALRFGIQQRLDTASDINFETSAPFGSSTLNVFYQAADIVGVLLIVLSIYGKYSAWWTIGDYAWYFGDFFFLRIGNAELTFRGIFELFPHPMYTVGYAWTYGCAILARSYTVLACCMVFHLSQLIFLTLVEVPYVSKLYDKSTLRRDSKAQKLEITAENSKIKAQYNAKGAKLRRKKNATFSRNLSGALDDSVISKTEQVESLPFLVSDVFMVKNFDIYNASDISLVLTALFFTLMMWVGSFEGGPLDDDATFVSIAIVVHLISASIKAFVLVFQERTRFWTRRFLRMGLSKRNAFNSWKRLYNLLLSLQNSAFLICAWRLSKAPKSINEVSNPRYISQLACGCISIVISMWSFQSCYEALGEYGWFYGDFFLMPSQMHDSSSDNVESKRSYASKEVINKAMDDIICSSPGSSVDMFFTKGHFEKRKRFDIMRPTYHGIYLYLNNPDIYLGHLWMYGIALICSSFEVAGLALLGHAIKIAFLQAVEKPHFRQVYRQNVRESSSAVEHMIRGKVKTIRNAEASLFLANWVKHPIDTGALAPSSEQLAKAMCEEVNLGDNSVVVELGPGTGAFTKQILQRLSQHVNTTYIALELNEDFIQRLKELFPEVSQNIFLESAENIGKVLEKRELSYCDTIISGLPWGIFPPSLQTKILDECYRVLRPGGKFSTFAYLSGLVLPTGQNFRKLVYQKFDGNVQRSSIQWQNLPPAFVYRAQRASTAENRNEHRT